MNLENQQQRDSIKDEIRRKTAEFKAERKKDEEEFRKTQQEKEEQYREFVRQKEDEITVLEREDSPKPYTRAEKAALKKEKREREKTRRKELALPSYTHGEELMNAISHIVGGAFSIAVIILGVFYAALQPEGTRLVSTVCMSVYGVCMLLLYSMSSIYHFLNVNRAKKVFQIIDHCTVYILIGATYVPVCALMLDNIFPYNYVLLGCVILAVIVGVALNATMMSKKAVKAVSYTLYVAVGWCIIFFYPWLVESAGIMPVVLLILGGVAYSVGAILYAIGRKKKYFHFIFHLFVLAGSALQFMCILLYLAQQIAL